MSTRDTILQVISQVREDKGLPPVPFEDAQPVGAEGLGLDSLDMATVVAELEGTLEVDPFARGNARFQTLGELVSLYERELAG